MSQITPRSNPSSQQDDQHKVSECILDYLLIALVDHYHSQQHLGPPPHAAIHTIGFRVGRTLAERLTREKPPMIEQLDILKWVCKDLWTAIFRKSIDNLRTNHRGTYVLRDTQFKWTARLSQNIVNQSERLGPNELAGPYLVLPCALIHGALSMLGLECSVTVDATTLPQCDFTVVVHSRSSGTTTTTNNNNVRFLEN